MLDSFGQGELSVIQRCPYCRGVRKERFHCINASSVYSTLYMELV